MEVQHLNLATLTIRGSKDSLEKVKSKIPNQPYRSWTQGDSITKTKSYVDYGFVYEIADTDTPIELTQAISTFLWQLNDNAFNANESLIDAELSIGVGVGDEKQFIASHQLSNDHLKLLVKCGISIEYSAYPVEGE
tara:strand:- start:53 stop:460 length:408 start_codon:yes stop_codon:yes gene_type:complete